MHAIGRPPPATIGLVLGLTLLWSAPAAAPFTQSNASARAEDAIARVIASGDNQGLSFAVIDKASATIHVLDGEGHLLGEAPVLIGLAEGDTSAPDIGDRPLSAIAPYERTTPAGRFVSHFGPSAWGVDVLWVDYETAISLHPVVTSNIREHRLARLASPTPNDNRITYGCINVPSAFYVSVIMPAFKGADGVVYILPEPPKGIEEDSQLGVERPAAAGPSGER